jgi:hypothetical protein
MARREERAWDELHECWQIRGVVAIKHKHAHVSIARGPESTGRVDVLIALQGDQLL